MNPRLLPVFILVLQWVCPSLLSSLHACSAVPDGCAPLSLSLPSPGSSPISPQPPHGLSYLPPAPARCPVPTFLFLFVSRRPGSVRVKGAQSRAASERHTNGGCHDLVKICPQTQQAQGQLLIPNHLKQFPSRGRLCQCDCLHISMQLIAPNVHFS